MVRRHAPGFTIIELIIVIVIMAILLTLGVVNLSSTQVQARDTQRSGNAQAIQAALESFWSQGNSTVAEGEYPSLQMTSGQSATTVATYLTDLNAKALTAPNNSNSDALVSATNATQSASGVQPQPSASNDVYVYQPIAGDGTLCSTDSQAWSGGNGTGCTSYNLYYYSETKSAVQMLTSRHHQ